MTGALRRYLTLIGILSLGLSGCLRSAGGDVGAPEGQAALNSPTPEPSPFEPIRETEIVEVIITTTPDPASQELFPDQETDVTPSELGALDLPAQDEGIPDDTDQQEQAQINPNLQTATAIIENATLQVIYQTQTAEAPVEPIATNTSEPVTQPTPAPGGPVFGGADCIHQVVTGENLFRLSLRYGVSIQDIAQASGIANPNLISVGQRLVIPGCGTTGQVPPPTTVADGSGGFGTGGPTTGTGGGTTYVVQQYDTLFEISMRYGVPIQSIAAANGISNINLIFIGDQLVIPSA